MPMVTSVDMNAKIRTNSAHGPTGSTTTAQPVPIKQAQPAKMGSDHKDDPNFTQRMMQFDETIPRTQSAPPGVDGIDVSNVAVPGGVSNGLPAQPSVLAHEAASSNVVSAGSGVHPRSHQQPYHELKPAIDPHSVAVSQLAKPANYRQHAMPNPYAQQQYYQMGYGAPYSPFYPSSMFYAPNMGPTGTPALATPSKPITMSAPKPVGLGQPSKPVTITAPPSKPVRISAPPSKSVVVKDPTTKEPISLTATPEEKTAPKEQETPVVVPEAVVEPDVAAVRPKPQTYMRIPVSIKSPEEIVLAKPRELREYTVQNSKVSLKSAVSIDSPIVSVDSPVVVVEAPVVTIEPSSLESETPSLAISKEDRMDVEISVDDLAMKLEASSLNVPAVPEIAIQEASDIDSSDMATSSMDLDLSINEVLLKNLEDIEYPEDLVYSKDTLLKFSAFVFELEPGFLHLSLSDMTEPAPSGRRSDRGPSSFARSESYRGSASGPPPGLSGKLDRASSDRSFRKPYYEERRGGRSGGMRSSQGRNSFYEDAQPQIILPQSENRWVRPDYKNSSAVDKVLRGVKGSLNKITADNFHKIVGKMIDSLVDHLDCLTKKFIAHKTLLEANPETPYEDSLDTEEEYEAMLIIKQVIDTFFDKAVDEPKFSPYYAQSVYEISNSDRLPKSFIQKSDGTLMELSLFRKLLLSKCQTEYQKKVAWSKERLEKLESAKSEATETNVEAKDDGKQASEDAVAAKQAAHEAEYERIKLKRRTLGNIAFIGHLYKNSLLNEKIIHSCIQELLSDIKNIEEEEIECCCQLFKTVGATIDQPAAKDLVSRYIGRLEKIINENDVSPRIKFLIMDLLDLRQANWVKISAEPLLSKDTRGTSASPASFAASRLDTRREDRRDSRDEKRGDFRRSGHDGKHRSSFDYEFSRGDSFRDKGDSRDVRTILSRDSGRKSSGDTFQKVSGKKAAFASSGDKAPAVEDDSSNRRKASGAKNMFELLNGDHEDVPMATEVEPPVEKPAPRVQAKESPREREMKQLSLIIFSLHKETPSKDELQCMAQELVAYTHLSFSDSLGHMILQSVDKSAKELELFHSFLTVLSPLVPALPNWKDSLHSSFKLLFDQFDDLKSDVPRLELVLSDFLANLVSRTSQNDLTSFIKTYEKLLVPLRASYRQNQSKNLTPVANFTGNFLKTLAVERSVDTMSSILEQASVDIQKSVMPSVECDTQEYQKLFLSTFSLEPLFSGNNELTESFSASSPIDSLTALPVECLSKLLERQRSRTFIAEAFLQDLSDRLGFEKMTLEDEDGFRSYLSEAFDQEILDGRHWQSLFALFAARTRSSTISDSLAVCVLNHVTLWWNSLKTSLPALESARRKLVLQTIFKTLSSSCDSLFSPTSYLSYQDEMSNIDKKDALFALNNFLMQTREQFENEQEEQFEEEDL